MLNTILGFRIRQITTEAQAEQLSSSPKFMNPETTSFRSINVFRFATILILLSITVPSALAQHAKSKVSSGASQHKESKGNTSKNTSSNTVSDASKSRENLIAATEAYKASLEKLRDLYADDEKRAADLLEKRQQLFEAGIIAKRELDNSQITLAEVRTKIEDTKKRLSEADNLIAEADALDQLAKMPAAPTGAYTSNLRMIRYAGPSQWSLGNLGSVEGFFRARFSRALPISAMGQSATHDRLGFDHRESVDIALHPDSAEGQELMAYLRTQGIPFIAFRSAVPGSATGAHIHIGRPSHRITPVGTR